MIMIIGILIFIRVQINTPPRSNEDIIRAEQEHSSAIEAENTTVKDEKEIQSKEDISQKEIKENNPIENDPNFSITANTELSESENYLVILSVLIPGTYKAENDIHFIFNVDETYEGYFNAEKTHVTGYCYELKGEVGKDTSIRIYNPLNEESVTYPLEFTSDGKIYMYYFENKSIELGI